MPSGTHDQALYFVAFPRLGRFNSHTRLTNKTNVPRDNYLQEQHPPRQNARKLSGTTAGTVVGGGRGSATSRGRSLTSPSRTTQKAKATRQSSRTTVPQASRSSAPSQHATAGVEEAVQRRPEERGESKPTPISARTTDFPRASTIEKPVEAQCGEKTSRQQQVR